MNYTVRYFCWSHAGKIRSINQDNFICDGIFMDDSAGQPAFPLAGCLTHGHPALIGVFDGMGGEECGEIASFLAAQQAAEVIIGARPLDALLQFCKTANGKICGYAAENQISAMGTTAALLAFTDSEIALCNIGDSKIFRFADQKLEQISVDHHAPAVYGQKPPLSQYLGIPPSEMVIDPYAARGRYHDGDIYLLCSDGLTDMAAAGDIAQILRETEFDKAGQRLLDTALEHGGKDNITIILCQVTREKHGLLGRIIQSVKEKGESSHGR